MKTYTVWIGGIPDIENVSYALAKKIYQAWIDQGYDDVLITEDWKGSHASTYKRPYKRIKPRICQPR